jgi:glycosyltransferase involved in cell wall biosynthesis
MRFFINIHYMELGGAERALLGLLNTIDTSRVQVDLFINQHTGEFMSLIPDKVNLLPERRGYNAIERPMRDIIKEGQWKVAMARLRARWQHHRYRHTLTPQQRDTDSSIFQYVADCVTPTLPSLYDLGEYDLAISWITPHNIVLDKVRARKKIAWIHTDYSTVHINAEKELKVWGRYDHIASISPDCTQAFLKVFPSLKEKIVEIENILSLKFVRQQANEDDVANEMPADGALRLLSIGRYCHPKNFDNVPDICRRIVESGLNVRWYIIGYGNDAYIRRAIDEAGMQEHVIILGKKSNPYPYIKACDIYVQPSRYEGKSVTVREAQVLCKPVIITAYPTANSQMQHGVDGIIVPLDNEGCAHGMVNAITHPEQLQTITQYLHTHDYGNEHEVEKIYELITQPQ